MKKFTCIMLSVLMFIFMLIGCSGQNTQNNDGAVSKSEDDIKGELTNEPKDPVTLTFTYWGSPVEKKAVEEAIKKFEEHYDWIKVEATHIPADYETKITSMVAGNMAPDVAYLGPSLAYPWAEEGKLYNILEFLDQDTELSKEDFLDNIWYNWDEDKSLGTNTACEAIGLFYNVEMFEEAGVELPPTRAEDAWTWDEFVEVAKQLTIDQNGVRASEPGFDPSRIKQYGIYFGTGWTSWLPMVHSNGGSYLSEDGSECTLFSPESIEAIQKMADLINVHHVAPSPIQAKSMPSPTVSLQSKQVAMAIEGQWVLLDLADAGFEFGVGVLPMHKESVTVVLGSPTVIFSSTEHPEESWLLFKWLANPESSLDLHAGGLWMPLLEDWYKEPELIEKWAVNNPAHPDGYTDAIMRQAMENGIPGPEYYVKNFGKINSIISSTLEQAWLGEKSVEEALKEVENEINAEVQGRYDNRKK